MPYRTWCKVASILLAATLTETAAATGHNLLYAVDRGTPAITVIDADTLASVQTINLTQGPGTARASRDGQTVFVNDNGLIRQVDTATHQIAGSLPASGTPVADPTPGFVWSVTSVGTGNGDGTVSLNRIDLATTATTHSTSVAFDFQDPPLGVNAFFSGFTLPVFNNTGTTLRFSAETTWPDPSPLSPDFMLYQGAAIGIPTLANLPQTPYADYAFVDPHDNYFYAISYGACELRRVTGASTVGFPVPGGSKGCSRLEFDAAGNQLFIIARADNGIFPDTITVAIFDLDSETFSDSPLFSDLTETPQDIATHPTLPRLFVKTANGIEVYNSLNLTLAITLPIASDQLLAFQRVTCGDAVIGLGEGCDDGNATDGDGCSTSCQIEQGWQCAAPQTTTIDLISGGGFEGGSPNPDWTVGNNGTPLCTTATCTGLLGGGPYQGSWFARFAGGGIFVLNRSISQTVTIPANATALLKFRLAVQVCPTVISPNYGLSIVVDGEAQRIYDETNCAVQPYLDTVVNLNLFADGEPHVITFSGFTISGTPNYLVDNVRLEIQTPVAGSCSALDPGECFAEDFGTAGGGAPQLFGWSTFGSAIWDIDPTCFLGNMAGTGNAACIFTASNEIGYLCAPRLDLTGSANLTGQFAGWNFDSTVITVFAGTSPPDLFSINDYLVLSDGFQSGNFSPQLDLSALAGEPAAWLCIGAGLGGITQVDDVSITGCNLTDTDNDGVPDSTDNCTDIINPDQYDSNADGIGSLCDGDVAGPGGGPEDCFVNFPDLDAMKAAFFSNPASPAWNPDLDFNNDSFVNFVDLDLLKDFFFLPPGPSASGCN